MSTPRGKSPAVALISPKFPHNVGNAFRACAALGATQLWVANPRFDPDSLKRLPREERMREYMDKVELIWEPYFFDKFPRDVTPVGVEVWPTAQPLTTFQHPEQALYVFGPEDGSIPAGYRGLCHQFVIIPTDHCLNLAAAVSCTLLDRRMKRQLAGLEEIRPAYATMQESRG